MSALVGAYLLTALLAQGPVQSGPAPTGGTDAVGSPASAPSQAGRQQGEGSSTQPPERLHEFGIGGSRGVGTRGGGGAFRYFFGDQIGFNTNIGWYRPVTSGSGAPRPSTFVVAPSMVYMLTKSQQVKDVDLRPYVGGGLNFASGASTTRTTSGNVSRTNGLGMQALAGVELTFREEKSIAISAEVAHYRMAASAFSPGTIEGTNFYLLFHYYLK